MTTTLEPQAGTRRAAAQPAATPSGNTSDTEALQSVLDALTAAAEGDFSVRLPARKGGLIGQIAARYNELVEMNARMAKELARVGRVIGREGRMTERMDLGAAKGGWGSNVNLINSL